MGTGSTAWESVLIPSLDLFSHSPPVSLLITGSLFPTVLLYPSHWISFPTVLYPSRWISFPTVLYPSHRSLSPQSSCLPLTRSLFLQSSCIPLTRSLFPQSCISLLKVPRLPPPPFPLFALSSQSTLCIWLSRWS